MEAEIIQMQQIFKFVKEQTDDKGNVIGHFTATGIRPHFLQELLPFGIEVSSTIFEAGRQAVGEILGERSGDHFHSNILWGQA